MSSANAIPNTTTPAASITRPLYWSIRRELWENRSIYIAPLAVAGLILIGFLIHVIYLPGKLREASALEPMQQLELIEQPYNFAALLMMGAYLIVALFYCLDALHGERRDRSILFWKSLPVSDLTTVLSKVVIPLVILPIISFVIVIGEQLIMVLETSVVLVSHGMSPASTWTIIPFFGTGYVSCWKAWPKLKCVQKRKTKRAV